MCGTLVHHGIVHRESIREVYVFLRCFECVDGREDTGIDAIDDRLRGVKPCIDPCCRVMCDVRIDAGHVFKKIPFLPSVVHFKEYIASEALR